MDLPFAGDDYGSGATAGGRPRRPAVQFIVRNTSAAAKPLELKQGLFASLLAVLRRTIAGKHRVPSLFAP